MECRLERGVSFRKSNSAWGHALIFSYFDSEMRPIDAQSEMDKTMVMDTNEYRSMIEKSDPKAEDAAETVISDSK